MKLSGNVRFLFAVLILSKILIYFYINTKVERTLKGQVPRSKKKVPFQPVLKYNTIFKTIYWLSIFSLFVYPARGWGSCCGCRGSSCWREQLQLRASWQLLKDLGQQTSRLSVGTLYRYSRAALHQFWWSEKTKERIQFTVICSKKEVVPAVIELRIQILKSVPWLRLARSSKKYGT
jgi:hypothetical protein